MSEFTIAFFQGTQASFNLLDVHVCSADDLICIIGITNYECLLYKLHCVTGISATEKNPI